jgi:AraC-like DNA-binding protein
MIQQHWYLLLEETMTKGEWWRDPSLTIYDLSEKVGLPAPLLVRLIQDRERYTFFEYVNKLRVEAVKRQLTATRSNNVNFATLARDTGFTSRRMMNRVFSRLTGSSPKTYKRLAAVTMISKNYQ